MKIKVNRAAFTLVEMLAVIAIIGLLVGILVPSLSRARRQAKTTTCSTRLRTLGQGLAIYANEYDDVLLPARMPRLSDEHWRLEVAGGLKYRPTFLAMLGTQLSIAPFADPQPAANKVDREGEPGDRQDYANEAYVCPETADWTDERNACYGYNYQFLGNARLAEPGDPFSFKNWPVRFSKIKSPGQTVAMGDSLGTAANFSRYRRGPYENNGRTLNARGNEGLVLDPPIIDDADGEVASHGGGDGGAPGESTGLGPFPESWPTIVSNGGEGEAARSGADVRHDDKANVLWLDGRVTLENLQSLGYHVEEDGSLGFGDVEKEEGNNRFWSGNQKNVPWKLR